MGRKARNTKNIYKDSHTIINEKGMCPYCKNKRISHGEIQLDRNDSFAFFPIECLNCGKTSREYYHLEYDKNIGATPQVEIRCARCNGYGEVMAREKLVDSDGSEDIGATPEVEVCARCKGEGKYTTEVEVG